MAGSAYFTRFSGHKEHRFAYKEENYAGLEREVRHVFERDFLNSILEDDMFYHLWDQNKLESIDKPSEVNFIKSPKWAPISRRFSGVHYRNPRSITRTVGLTRYVFKNMLERGVLPGMYRTGW